jgi:hypothetical protein
MTTMASSHSEIKELVARYFTDNLRASPSMESGSIITLPIKTVDDRWVSVMIEEKHGYFLVHDGGKTDSELFCQGVQMSDDVEQFNTSVAAKYQLRIENGIIQRTCQINELPQTIMAVAEAATVIAAQLVSQLAEPEVPAVRGTVSEALRLWKSEDFRIEENPQIEGRLSAYTMTFVAWAQNQMHSSAAINILPHSNSSNRALKYALMLLDLKGIPSYKDLVQIALVLKADQWSEPSLELVNKVADETMTVTPNTQVESRIRQIENKLAAPKAAPRL